MCKDIREKTGVTVDMVSIKKMNSYNSTLNVCQETDKGEYGRCYLLVGSGEKNNSQNYIMGMVPAWTWTTLMGSHFFWS